MRDWLLGGMNNALDQRPKDVNPLKELRRGWMGGGQKRQFRVERAEEFLGMDNVDDAMHIRILALQRALPLGERG